MRQHSPVTNHNIQALESQPTTWRTRVNDGDRPLAGSSSFSYLMPVHFVRVEGSGNIKTLLGAGSSLLAGLAATHKTYHGMSSVGSDEK